MSNFELKFREEYRGCSQVEAYKKIHTIEKPTKEEAYRECFPVTIHVIIILTFPLTTFPAKKPIAVFLMLICIKYACRYTIMVTIPVIPLLEILPIGFFFGW